MRYRVLNPFCSSTTSTIANSPLSRVRARILITSMTEFTSTSRAPLPEIPDDLSIPQFMLDYKHPYMQHRPENVPWLTEDHSGRSIGFQEVRFPLTRSLYGT